MNRFSLSNFAEPIVGEITYGDELFATVLMLGRVVCEFSCRDCNTMNELLAKAYRQVSAAPGVYGIKVRNRTKGWRTKKVIVVRHQTMLAHAKQSTRA